MLFGSGFVLRGRLLQSRVRSGTELGAKKKNRRKRVGTAEGEVDGSAVY